RQFLRTGKFQGRNPPNHFPSYVKCLPAGSQDSQIWTSMQQIFGEVRARFGEMLAVVEDQQHVPLTNALIQSSHSVTVRFFLNAQRRGNFAAYLFSRA